MTLKGQVIVITGGSSGLGRATAHHLVNHGASVVITGRSQQRLDDSVRELPSSSNVVAIVADVRSEDDWLRVVATAVDRFQRIDALINNAGWEGPGDPDYTLCSTDDIKTLFDTNILGPTLGAKFVIPELLKTQGSIVTISSIASCASRSSGTAFALYGPTKAADDAIVRQLHALYGRRGVRSYGLNPCTYRTAMVDHVVNENVAAASIGANTPERLGWFSNPLGNIGDPLDVAVVIRSIVEAKTRFPPGECIVVIPGLTPGSPFTTAIEDFYRMAASLDRNYFHVFADLSLCDVSGQMLTPAEAHEIRAHIANHITEVVVKLTSSAPSTKNG